MVAVNGACSNCGDPVASDRNRCGKCSPGRTKGKPLPTSPSWSRVNLDEAIRLRAKDPKKWSYAALGRKYGVSRQCVDKVLRVYQARRDEAVTACQQA